MSQWPVQLPQEGGWNPDQERWLSFREAFESQGHRQFLESMRPELPCSTVTLPNTSSTDDFSLSAYLIEGGEMDEELLTERFRDYLLTTRNDPNAESIPLPGMILDEYLCAFGPQEPSFWRKLPMATIFRVTEGESPISSKLSAQLSRVFGTHRRFWFDLQVEYNRWKSGAFDGQDSDDQQDFDDEKDFET
jgi:plasmid maintenance system antidote protein VapI